MERITKALLILTTLLVAVSLEVEGGRILKSNEQVEHPQNFFVGGAGGGYHGPGIASGFGLGPNGFYTVGNVPGLPNFPGPPSNDAPNP